MRSKDSMSVNLASKPTSSLPVFFCVIQPKPLLDVDTEIGFCFLGRELEELLGMHVRPVSERAVKPRNLDCDSIQGNAGSGKLKARRRI
jgi:hypothetical protein